MMPVYYLFSIAVTLAFKKSRSLRVVPIYFYCSSVPVVRLKVAYWAGRRQDQNPSLTLSKHDVHTCMYRVTPSDTFITMRCVEDRHMCRKGRSNDHTHRSCNRWHSDFHSYISGAAGRRCWSLARDPRPCYQ